MSGKVHWNGCNYVNIQKVSLVYADKRNTLKLINDSGASKEFQFKGGSLRVMMKGNMQSLICGNIGYVFGNVGNVEVGNCLSVEGLVNRFENSRGILYDKWIDCKAQFEEASSSLHKNYKRTSVLSLTNVPFVELGGGNMSTLPILEGNVSQFVCGNLGYIKGNVGFAKVSNCLYCTMGNKPTAAEIKEKRRQERMREEQERMSMQALDAALADIFKR